MVEMESQPKRALIQDRLSLLSFLFFSRRNGALARKGIDTQSILFSLSRVEMEFHLLSIKIK